MILQAEKFIIPVLRYVPLCFEANCLSLSKYFTFPISYLWLNSSFFFIPFISLFKTMSPVAYNFPMFVKVLNRFIGIFDRSKSLPTISARTWQFIKLSGSQAAE